MGVKHLSDKNQSIILSMGMINWAVSQKHSSLEKEGVVIPHQAVSPLKTGFVSAHTWFCYSNTKDMKRYLKAFKIVF